MSLQPHYVYGSREEYLTAINNFLTQACDELNSNHTLDQKVSNNTSLKNT